MHSHWAEDLRATLIIRGAIKSHGQRAKINEIGHGEEHQTFRKTAIMDSLYT